MQFLSGAVVLQSWEDTSVMDSDVRLSTAEGDALPAGFSPLCAPDREYIFVSRVCLT